MQWKPRVRSNQLRTHPRWWRGSSRVCAHPHRPRPTARAKARARTRSITGTTTNLARAAVVVAVAGTTTARSTRAVTNRPRTAVIKSLIPKTKTMKGQRAKAIHTQRAAVAGGTLGTAALKTKARTLRVVTKLRGAARPLVSLPTTKRNCCLSLKVSPTRKGKSWRNWQSQSATLPPLWLSPRRRLCPIESQAQRSSSSEYFYYGLRTELLEVIDFRTPESIVEEPNPPIWKGMFSTLDATNFHVSISEVKKEKININIFHLLM